MTVVGRKNETEELIVGLANLGMVVNKLEELDVESSEPDKSVPLGLARIVLTSVNKAAKTMSETANASDDAMRQVAGRTEPDDPIGRVLWGLRGLLGAENAGFMPVMGRNRTVGPVHEVGKVWHGGGGYPEELKADEIPPPLLTTRPVGPGRGVRVGVLDTTLFPHPWLAGGWAAQFSDTITDDSPLLAPQGHATFVTGLVLSQAPGATVQVQAVLESDGSADSWTAAKAIVDLGNSGIDVLNLSFLCFTDDNQPPLALSTAVDRVDTNVVIVAAAGNHGDLPDAEGNPRTDDAVRVPVFPGACDVVTAVGASDESGKRADFSPDARWVDVLAPGVGLLSTYLPRAKVPPNGKIVDFAGLARWSGTSFSAALISGAIAAGTDPGRISSRESLQNILKSLQQGAPNRGMGPNPPNVNLRTF